MPALAFILRKTEPKKSVKGKQEKVRKSIHKYLNISEEKRQKAKKMLRFHNESRAFNNGGDGEIRTLEELLTLTRFPIVRARPTTRHLRVVRNISLFSFSLAIIIHAYLKVKEYFLVSRRISQHSAGIIEEKNCEVMPVKMSSEEYNEYASRYSPRSRTGRNLLRAFVSGGAVCALGQLILNAFTDWGLGTDSAATATCVTLIFLGALLTGLGIYDDMARFAGAGTLVPITGFANSVAAPALEFKTEGFILGTAVKMFTIAGPVIVYGISASVVYGLVLVIFGLA